MKDLPFCKCGCGERVSRPGNTYIYQHHHRGKPSWMSGKKHTIESKIKLSNSCLGREPWNKRIPRTEEEKLKISQGKLGKPLSEKHKLAIKVTCREKQINSKPERMQLVIDKMKDRAAQMNPEINLALKKAADWTCSRCGFRERPVDNKFNQNRIHVHHILCTDLFPELVNDVSNCIVVCKSCHKQLHYKINKQISNLMEFWDNHIFSEVSK